MSIRLPRIIALAPQGSRGSAVAIAASRSGSLGLLDLCDSPATESEEGITPISKLASGGIRLALDQVDQFDLAGVATICLVSRDWKDARHVIERLKQEPRRILAEVTSPEAALQARVEGVDGLILAGHEAGGICGEVSSFILLQAVMAQGEFPVWVRGGIGLNSAGACVAAGATGVVLDGALLLTRESPLDESAREILARSDGGETEVVRLADGGSRRVFAIPGSAAHRAMKEGRPFLAGEIGWKPGQAWPIGQDASFAARLARKYVTVGGVIHAVEAAIATNINQALSLRPLAESSPLALAHATRYPIVQGPMTRVSDNAAFAEAVAAGGALPFLALAMSTGSQVAALLDEVKIRLAGQSWGVGLLGFIDPDLRSSQVAAIRAARPPFALIAGGRPDQARALEDEGIPTYLHVPSPGLLARYLREGTRRFVLEGRECGGHVGPRSSLVLWEQAVAVVTDHLDAGEAGDPIHLLFAGGIHDSRSAAAVATLAAPLAGRGVKLGVLIGTAYLFTEEAVVTGAVVPRFQTEAIHSQTTVLLETGPGHEVRVSPSPFADSFVEERRRLFSAGKSADEVRESLEALNIGRLRIAAKGVDRSQGEGSPIIKVSETDQYRKGIYMLGEVATLRHSVTNIATLHSEISVDSTKRLDELAVAFEAKSKQKTQPADIAIIGMSSFFPGAASAREFWENTLGGRDAITEIPPDRWDWRLYYDADPKAPDKVISKWGGFVPDIPIDPLHYGMPPSSLPSIEPVQLLLLEAVRAAIDDAGYTTRAFPRDRTAVVLGMGGGAAQLAMGYAFRAYLPMLETVAPEAGREARLKSAEFLPEWTEDSFPGFLLNVAAGRIANRFDLGGSNYTVDAACGSSLAAAALAVRELETGNADMVVLGGADTVQNPLTYLAFSKTHAFSPRGRCRPFDASADGIVISEGVGVVILKRLADAERDGDRIYAVIKGVGSSSDGRARGLTAPNPDGQERALKRAYEKADVSPATLGYVEAHGTGTAVGDVVEMNALSHLLTEAGSTPASCTVGSVKSMIGHTKCAAGLAGLINASLALHHRVLPPTIGINEVNPKTDLVNGPLRAQSQPRPWFHATDDRPRRAGVSAFGFGGTNFHAVLEAYDQNLTPRVAPLSTWPAELLLWRADTPEAIAAALDTLVLAAEKGARPHLRDLARTLAERFEMAPRKTGPTLAIVASSFDDFLTKAATARKALKAGEPAFNDPSGIYYAAQPRHTDAEVAFVFPGQGAQSLDMLADLALVFPEVREAFEQFDKTLITLGKAPITPKIFPSTTLDHAAKEAARHALMATDVAQPAIGAASVGMLRLLARLGVVPHAVAGHSYGELVALHAAGCVSAADLAELSEARGRFMNEAAGNESGAMAAVAAGSEVVAELIAGINGVVVANHNGPRQTVISGDRDAIAQAIERSRVQGIRTFELPTARAFHSPSVAGASAPFAMLAAERLSGSPAIPVFANIDALPHPADLAAIAQRLGRHIASPVRFAGMIEAMHEHGAKVFIEVGPGKILTPLTESILNGRDVLALALDAPGRNGIVSLLHGLARLSVAGLSPRVSVLTEGRETRRLDLESLPAGDGSIKPSASTWLVNGSRVRPINGPEPKRLGQKDLVASETLASAVQKPRAVAEVAGDRFKQNGSHDTVESSMKANPSNGSNGHTEHKNGHQNGTVGMNGHSHADSKKPSSNGRHSPDDSARVMEAFQQTMRTFLEVQQATMNAYLARGTAAPMTTGFVADVPAPRPVAPKTIAPPTPPAPIPTPPEPVVASAPTPKKDEPSPRTVLVDRLLSIVKDRTGYPTEMLKLDLDLEADLGIDSIKRVEILGTLRESVDGLGSGTDSSVMDGLARAKTLGEIINRVEAARSKSQPSKPVIATKPQSPTQRLRIESVEAPLPESGAGLMQGGAIVVTDDGRGIAQALGDQFRRRGHQVALLQAGSLDLGSPSEVADALARVRAEAPIAGVMHLLPLQKGKDHGLDSTVWHTTLRSELQGLFHLAQATCEDLEVSAQRGGSCLIAATALGGRFGSAGLADKAFAGQGGIAGFMKTVAREWTSIRSRVVDTDASEPASLLSAYLCAEAFVDDGWPEVGYVQGRRIRLGVVPAPVGSRGGAFEIHRREPILVTGGARGITAAVALRLAQEWQPTLLLVGSSPAPGEAESAATAGLVSASELKAALLGRLRKEGRDVGPAEVERAYRSLQNERSIRETLRAIRETGATAEYAMADVRDSASLESVMTSWRRRHGNPVGLIHGAGVIHDKLLRDKTPESFDRVFGTKVDGALNLLRMMAPESLKFTALFSSVAGRFGNKGQADYAAANDALNKLALWLDNRWPGRVLSLNWGPWSGVGMVSELESHLGRRGLGMISPQQGCEAFVQELKFGRKGEVEVIIANALGSLDEPLRSPVPAATAEEVLR